MSVHSPFRFHFLCMLSVSIVGPWWFLFPFLCMLLTSVKLAHVYFCFPFWVCHRHLLRRPMLTSVFIFVYAADIYVGPMLTSVSIFVHAVDTYYVGPMLTSVSIFVYVADIYYVGPRRLLFQFLCTLPNLLRRPTPLLFPFFFFLYAADIRSAPVDFCLHFCVCCRHLLCQPMLTSVSIFVYAADICRPVLVSGFVYAAGIYYVGPRWLQFPFFVYVADIYCVGFCWLLFTSLCITHNASFCYYAGLWILSSGLLNAEMYQIMLSVWR